MGSGTYRGPIEPLEKPPARPLVDDAGAVLNPLGEDAPVRLDDDVPVGYSDLRPDTRYVSRGFEYFTNEQALPARVRGALRIVPASQRVRHRTVQKAAGRLARTRGLFHGGHIVAVSLGGYASGPNLFPQQHNFNISAYARLERGWRRALARGLSIEVDIALTLDEDPAVPQFVIVTYWENDEEWEHALLNEPNAQ